MLNVFFKGVLDEDRAPIVICDLNHDVVYMNPAAHTRYKIDLVGRSIFSCHSPSTNEKIKKVVSWFSESSKNNRVFTSYNPEENKDVYMVALRNNTGQLIGYYEKHEYRTPEQDTFYHYN